MVEWCCDRGWNWGDLESRSKKRAFGAKMMLKSTPANVEVRPKGIEGRKRSSSVPIVHGVS